VLYLEMFRVVLFLKVVKGNGEGVAMLARLGGEQDFCVY
jgi:hypothetical protein